MTVELIFSPVLPDSVDPNDQKKTACYDIDVEVEDPLKSQMSSFLLSTANQQEIASLDNKVKSQHVRVCVYVQAVNFTTQRFGPNFCLLSKNELTSSQCKVGDISELLQR